MYFPFMWLPYVLFNHVLFEFTLCCKKNKKKTLYTIWQKCNYGIRLHRLAVYGGDLVHIQDGSTLSKMDPAPLYIFKGRYKTPSDEFRVLSDSKGRASGLSPVARVIRFDD